MDHYLIFSVLVPFLLVYWEQKRRIFFEKFKKFADSFFGWGSGVGRYFRHVFDILKCIEDYV